MVSAAACGRDDDLGGDSEEVGGVIVCGEVAGHVDA